MGKNIHVTHDKQRQKWNVKEEGNPIPKSSHRTQTEAIDHGRERAQVNHSELVIHNRNNVIRDKDSYGNDPNPPKDKKH